MKFTRKMLEELTSHLVDRTLQMVGAGAGGRRAVSTKDIDEVMLVGGQTRMPIVQERLTKFFGKTAVARACTRTRRWPSARRSTPTRSRTTPTSSCSCST